MIKMKTSVRQQEDFDYVIDEASNPNYEFSFSKLASPIASSDFVNLTPTVREKKCSPYSGSVEDTRINFETLSKPSRDTCISIRSTSHSKVKNMLS